MVTRCVHSGMNNISFLPDAKRKLNFLGKEGYDIFGKSALFVPRLKYEALEKNVKDIKNTAEVYEEVFNDIISDENNNQNLEQVSQITVLHLQFLSRSFTFFLIPVVSWDQN